MESLILAHRVFKCIGESVRSSLFLCRDGDEEAFEKVAVWQTSDEHERIPPNTWQPRDEITDKDVSRCTAHNPYRLRALQTTARPGEPPSKRATGPLRLGDSQAFTLCSLLLKVCLALKLLHHRSLHCNTNVHVCLYCLPHCEQGKSCRANDIVDRQHTSTSCFPLSSPILPSDGRSGYMVHTDGWEQTSLPNKGSLCCN